MGRRGALIVSAIVVLAHAGVVGAQSASTTLAGPDIAVGCAPSVVVVPEREPVHTLRVIGAQDTTPRSLFGVRDLVVISAGTREKVQLDQQYYVRRAFAFGHALRGHLGTIHTTGWLRIVAVNDTTAIARVEQSCDGIIAGDYLEPFVTPAAPAEVRQSEGTSATLDFSLLGRVVFGDEQRRIAGSGDFMMVDQGNAHLVSGSRVAIYRDLRMAGIPLTAIGEGVIVSSGDTQLLRVTTQRDAIQGGDYVVPHK
jgi:hypothetical protein